MSGLVTLLKRASRAKAVERFFDSLFSRRPLFDLSRSSRFPRKTAPHAAFATRAAPSAGLLTREHAVCDSLVRARVGAGVFALMVPLFDILESDERNLTVLKQGEMPDAFYILAKGTVVSEPDAAARSPAAAPH